MHTLEDFFDFSNAPHAIRIKGHRIGIEHVLEQYRSGKNAEEIASFFPTLRREDVYATILYYLLNCPELDDYLRDYEEIGRRMSTARDADPSPAGLRLRRLWRQRQEERQRAGAVSR